ncbi:hypothetical protein HYH96_00425 [Clostridium botulinum]|uniref:Uncharacterized protein n=1 Tax=Clostridium botulinum (strain Langeland / NCTC 10281 / Type F) TaxID=441772 RepID=A7GFQ2_CLOBL|nr:hypothetical protein [Clostridium botulinum]ABS39832.1 hypothetical protein CLI_2369 [Clostridium botulinum F str. Langeland]ADG00022.1 hypothetical protein CBF_2359 [Clostridium botulinum F str. 230613]KKM42420.1 hypothetical protein VT72_01915 [Clostridium botulinum]MBD5642371.1 hypothetical protein [Clostridium botulinum]MBY6793093.1 hypothetical protein [Clostridium botulinum]
MKPLRIPDLILRKIYLKDNTVGYLCFIKGLAEEYQTQENFVTPIMALGLSDFLEESTVYKIPTINLSIYKEFNLTTKAILSLQ